MSLEDLVAEFNAVLAYTHRQVRRVDQELHDWRLFELDLVPAGCDPLVLLMGNHSSGKSTFTNNLCGVHVQDTGSAPTTSCFTILERGTEDADEDGHTLAAKRDGCMRGFEDLGRWGETFKDHLRLSRRRMPADALLPEHLLVVDTPGMIDAPGAMVEGSPFRGHDKGNERPYRFEEVTRWFARRAAVVLLFFDPANPGTTGETLDVWAKALNDYGDRHKLTIVLNKVDECQSAADFARTYGTLCWNLARVLRQKDIPRVETMFNELEGRQENQLQRIRANRLPISEFTAARKKVIAEVLAAPLRHYDNALTNAEATVERLDMVCHVFGAAAAERWQRRAEAAAAAGLLCVPLAGWLRAVLRRQPEWRPGVEPVPAGAAGAWPSVAALCGAGLAVTLLRLRLWRQRVSESAQLDHYFNVAYGRRAEEEALRQRWDAGGGSLPALGLLGGAPTAAAAAGGVKGRLQQVLCQQGGPALVQATPAADRAAVEQLRRKHLPRLREVAAALKRKLPRAAAQGRSA